MKRSEVAFSFASVVVDALMLVGAGMISYEVRFEFPSLVGLAPATSIYPLSRFWGHLIAIVAVGLVVLAANGLYQMASNRRFRDDIPKIISACSTMMLVVIVILFFQREMFLSRFLVLAAWVISVALVIAGRIMVKVLQMVTFLLGIGVHRVVLVGRGTVCQRLKQEIAASRFSGYRVVKVVAVIHDYALKDLKGYYDHDQFDEMIIADPWLEKTLLHSIIDWAREFHVPLRYAIDLFGFQSVALNLTTVGSTPLVEPKRTPLEGWHSIGKRATDIVGSLLLLIVTSPIMVLAAIAILLDSGFPVFYRSDRSRRRIMRVGRRGKLFPYWKFRTMVRNADELREELKQLNERKDGPLYKITNDPRITPVGRILRRYSIDELPELFLVLKGSMSLVGPRPHRPEEVEQYQRHHREVFAVKPGITGLAQVSGRHDLTFEEEVRLDSYYVHHWSMFVDLWILLKTPLVVLKGTGT